MTNMTIDQPQSSDIQETQRLLKTVIEDTFKIEKISLLYPEEIDDEIAAKVSSLEQSLNQNNHDRDTWFVAKIEEKVIGTIAYGEPNQDIKKNYQDRDLEALEVKFVYISPDFQRKGIATHLVKHALESLKKENVKHFFLDSGFPRAQKYWSHRIGQPSRVITDYYGKGQHFMIWYYPVETVLNFYKTKLEE